MKKYHADLDPSEDSGEQMEKNWPNGKLILIRLAACILGGIVLACFLVSMAVIIINKIMETKP